MATLSDRDIFSAIDEKIIAIDPLIANNVQPASIDLTLDRLIDVFEPTESIDLVNISSDALKKQMREVDITDGYTLNPGKFIVGYTAEKIKLSSFVTGRIFNRNSLARCGLDAAISSFVNPGFSGRKIIVIHNFGHVPLIIRAGIRICQLEISMLGEKSLRTYENRHNLEELKSIYNITVNDNLDKVPLDSSLSDFLDARIKAAASR